jgi:hypothetical protein
VACLICTVRSIAKDGNFINESGGERSLVNWSTRKEVYLFTNQKVSTLFEQQAFTHVAHVSRRSSLSVQSCHIKKGDILQISLLFLLLITLHQVPNLEVKPSFKAHATFCAFLHLLHIFLHILETCESTCFYNQPVFSSF